jgi:hypothetical protein
MCCATIFGLVAWAEWGWGGALVLLKRDMQTVVGHVSLRPWGARIGVGGQRVCSGGRMSVEGEGRSMG